VSEDAFETAEVPEPPWLRRRPRRTRPSLSRETIVEAALRVLDREGASGLSMRRIAEELGCGAGAIYWHVDNKEQLIQLVFDRVIAELPLPEHDPARWREQVKETAHAERDLMRKHPGIAQLQFGRIPLGPNAIRFFEWHLALMRGGGLSDTVAALAGDLLNLYIGAFAYEESVGMRPPSGEEVTEGDFVAEMHAYLAALPADRFPNLSGLADEIMRADRDERFDFGLDVLLEGLVGLSKQRK
jgi:AcrR family transcriptional regulator